MGVNPSEGLVVQAKSRAGVTAVNPIDGAVGTKTKPRLKPKIGGSLIPPKGKLVKKLMWNCMVRAIASCFYPITKPAYSSELTLPIKHTCSNKEEKENLSGLNQPCKI